jgi:hypothetical protein
VFGGTRVFQRFRYAGGGVRSCIAIHVLRVSFRHQKDGSLPAEAIQKEKKQGSRLYLVRAHCCCRRVVVVSCKAYFVGRETGDSWGFAHEIRKLRNFVHSGVWAREQQDTTKFTKRVYDVVFEVYDVAVSWLLHRVHTNLRKRMEREARKNP